MNHTEMLLEYQHRHRHAESVVLIEFEYNLTGSVFERSCGRLAFHLISGSEGEAFDRGLSKESLACLISELGMHVECSMMHDNSPLSKCVELAEKAS